MTGRLRKIGIVLAVFGLVFMAGGAFAAFKVQEGYRSLDAFSAAQGVTLTYNEEGQLVDRGEVAGAQAIMTLYLPRISADIIDHGVVTGDTGYIWTHGAWMLAVALGLTSIAGGFISPAMTAATVNAAGTRHANTAGSVLNANRQFGSLVGIASTGAVLAVAPGWTAGAALSFLLVGAAYIAAALIAWRLIHLPERRQVRIERSADE